MDPGHRFPRSCRLRHGICCGLGRSVPDSQGLAYYRTLSTPGRCELLSIATVLVLTPSQWLKRVATVLSDKTAKGAGSFTKIPGEEAAKIVTSAKYDDSTSFDEEQGKLLGLAQGTTVSIVPDDTGTVIKISTISLS
jgi:hypothetical protein